MHMLQSQYFYIHWCNRSTNVSRVCRYNHARKRDCRKKFDICEISYSKKRKYSRTKTRSFSAFRCRCTNHGNFPDRINDRRTDFIQQWLIRESYGSKSRNLFIPLRFIPSLVRFSDYAST